MNNQIWGSAQGNPYPWQKPVMIDMLDRGIRLLFYGHYQPS